MFTKILKKLYIQIANPRYHLSSLFIYRFHWLISKINILKKNKNFQEGVLIWDIRSNPTTFDIVYYIYLAYVFFDKKNIKKFDVLILIPKSYVFNYRNKDYSKFVSGKDMQKRIHSMIVPILYSFNCIKKVTIINCKKTIFNISKLKVTFPEFYNPYYYFLYGFESYKDVYKLLKKNVNYNLYSKSKISREKILNEITNGSDINDYITFTLRDYGYAPIRNSSSSIIKLIYDFSKEINKKLILVPDNIEELKHYEIPSDVLIHKGARKNIDMRIALYQFSEVNIFMQSGPSDLSHFKNHNFKLG